MKNVRTISGSTGLYGILGNPIKQTLSPLIHNAAFESKKIDSIYVPFPTQTTGPFLKKAILSMGLRGLSVTIPHKKWACKTADKRDRLSELCGASNTLIIEKNKLHAYNTDGPGAMQALSEKFKTTGRRYLIIGYGGSALAIAHQLIMDAKPAMVWITGRNKKKANALGQELSSAHKCPIRVESFDQIPPEEIDAIIQTTPLGMTGSKSTNVPDKSSALDPLNPLPGLPFDPNWIRRHHLVFDIVYNPMRTPLMELAEKKGARIVYGYKMLLYQATRQFQLFTNEPAPESLMERLLVNELRQRQK